MSYRSGSGGRGWVLAIRASRCFGVWCWGFGARAREGTRISIENFKLLVAKEMGGGLHWVNPKPVEQVDIAGEEGCGSS